MHRQIPLQLLVCIVLFSSALAAQEGGESVELDEDALAPVDRAAPAALEEIVVTAQRRSSTVQKTPISIEAFGEEKLDLRGIGGLEDLAANVPSMVTEPHPLGNTAMRIFIRGVGVNDAQITQDAAVGIYIDGVYLARSVGLALDLADVQRIEVLRGPQGVLYGRNATGGAVNIISRKPDPAAFSMRHKLTLGERNLLTAKSSFNLPLGEDLAVKLALLGRHSDGFVENTGPGGDFGDRQEWALRFDASYLASDWLNLDYSYDQTDLSYFNAIFQAIIPPNTNHGLAEFFKPYAQTQTVYSERRLDALATSVPLLASGSRVKGHTLSLTGPLWDLPWGTAELKYIGAYRALEDDQYPELGGGKGSADYRLDFGAYDSPAARLENDGNPTPAVVPHTEQSQWSHELQIAGTALQDSVEYIAGLYHFTEKGFEDGSPANHITSAIVDPQQMQFLVTAVPGLSPLLRDELNPKFSVFWDYLYQIKNSAYAVFGQASWRPQWMDGRWNFTLGLRQSWDERYAIKDFVQTQYAEFRQGDTELAPVPVPGEPIGAPETFVDVRASSTYSDFSPSANIQFDLNENATSYLSYATAYKSGGFNLRDPQISGESGPASDGTDYGFGFVEGYRPEKVKSLEMGIKSQWLQRSLRLNAAVFNARYQDMQNNFLIAGTISDLKSRNTGKARMRGFEIDTAFVPSRHLVLALQYAFLDAKVKEVIDKEGNNVAHLYPFTAAPPHSYVASIDWTLLNAAWGSLRGYLHYQYIGDRTGFVVTEERRGLTAIDGYGLLNARLILGDLSVLGGDAEIALWGKNLADEEYPLTVTDNLPHADRALAWGPPRTLGLDLSYRFE